MNQKLITKRNKIATTVQFTFPVPLISEELHQEAEGEAKTAYVMTLLRHGEITSGRAARLLGISRLEAIDLMANFGISVFATQTRAELAGEVTNTWMDRDINGSLGILLRALVDTPSLESIRSAFVNEC